MYATKQSILLSYRLIYPISIFDSCSMICDCISKVLRTYNYCGTRMYKGKRMNQFLLVEKRTVIWCRTCECMYVYIHDFVVASYNNNCSHFAENLALRKPTWQFPSFDGLNNFGDRAVDGKRSNLHWYGGECSVSAINESTVEWRVDLGEVLSIHHIFIQYATNNQEWSEQFSTDLFFSVYEKRATAYSYEITHSIYTF